MAAVGEGAAAMAVSQSVRNAPMALETWTAFALAFLALLLIPGPTMLPVIGQSTGAGQGSRRRAPWHGAPPVAGLATAAMRRA